jgi:hypothetical protein
MQQTMPKFRKKPVTIRAIRNEGRWSPIRDFLFDEADYQPVIFERPPVRGDGTGTLLVDTLEGTMTCSVGDWLICGIKGELYPCRHDIFEATYEEA